MKEAEAGVLVVQSEPAWRCSDPPQYPLPSDEKSWERCQKILDELDSGMCSGWKDEIQSLLIFVGSCFYSIELLINNI